MISNQCVEGMKSWSVVRESFPLAKLQASEAHLPSLLNRFLTFFLKELCLTFLEAILIIVHRL